MKGLEFSIVQSKDCGCDSRIDAEFFSKSAIAARHIIGSLETTALSQYAEIADGDHATFPNESEGTIPYLQARDINGFVSPDGEAFVTAEYFARNQRSSIGPSTVLISIMGTVGRIGITEPSHVPCMANRAIGIIRPKAGTSACVLFAYLGSRIAQEMILAYSSGGVQRRINLDLLKGLPVPAFSRAFNEAVNITVGNSFKMRAGATSQARQAETVLTSSIGLAGWNPPEPLTYTCKASEALASNRLDAEFHRPIVEALFHKLASRFNLRNLGELGVVENGQTVPYDENGSVPIIRSGDLSDIDDDSRFLRAGSATPIFKLKRGDVLVSSIGFGSIGKIQVFDKSGTYGTVSEVTVIRQNEVNPYYLASFLRSTFGQMQIDRYITGATGQLHLYKRDVRKFFLPEIPYHEQKRFELLAREAFEARVQARASLDKAKRAVEITIEDSEASALKYLKEK